MYLSFIITRHPKVFVISGFEVAYVSSEFSTKLQVELCGVQVKNCVLCGAVFVSSCHKNYLHTLFPIMFLKIVSAILVLSSGFLLGASADQCIYDGGLEAIADLKFTNEKDECAAAIQKHISKELEASLTYIVLGAHFLQANHFRPGVAHMFLKHASEERQHAKALMDYLLMRGYELKDPLFPELKPLLNHTNWGKSETGDGNEKTRVMDGLKVAFNIEKYVRDAFVGLIKTCEDTDTADHADSDYHASDVLTGEFLDEQHKGVRELAGHLSTLDRLLKNGGSHTLAEMEFDRTLMEGA